MLKKIVSVFLSIIIITSLTGSVFAESVSDIKAKKEQAQEKKEEVQEEKSETMQEVQKLNESINESQDKLSDLNSELDDLSKEISTLKQEVEKKEKEYQDQDELLQERIQAQYEAGDTTYLDVLLNSTGVSDFLSNYFLVSEVLENDSDLLSSIENQKTKIEKDKKSLEEKQKNVKTKKIEQEKLEVVLNNQKAQKQSKISQLSDQEKKLSADIDKYNKAILQLEAAARAASRRSYQRAQSGSYSANTKYVGGKMLWPCPSSSYISSGFGGRRSPGGVGSTNHKGIDIAASAGSAIVAALDGTVIYTGYNVARGNYVMVDHGGGIITLYQHGLNGSICVSSGQTVKQGQRVMSVGSTGYSTGPHLHFEVWENGTPVNPISYVSA